MRYTLPVFFVLFSMSNSFGQGVATITSGDGQFQCEPSFTMQLSCTNTPYVATSYEVEVFSTEGTVWSSVTASSSEYSGYNQTRVISATMALENTPPSFDENTLLDVTVTINGTEESICTNCFSLYSMCTEISAVNDVLCPGTTITSSNTGAVGDVTYLWSNGETGAQIEDVEAGTYTVTTEDTQGFAYTSESITINETEDANFNYSSATYNIATASNPTPTITGSFGGSFSATSGLSINTSSGTIDLSNSTPGTYTITYESPGTCPGSETTTITLSYSSAPQDCASVNDFMGYELLSDSEISFTPQYTLLLDSINTLRAANALPALEMTNFHDIDVQGADVFIQTNISAMVDSLNVLLNCTPD